MSKRILISVFVASIAIVIIIGLYYFSSKNGNDSNDSNTSTRPTDEARVEQLPSDRPVTAVADTSALASYKLAEVSDNPSVQEIYSLAMAGNPAAQRVLSEIYSDCQFYSLNHEAFIDTVRSIWMSKHKTAPKKAERLLGEHVDLCDQLDGGDPIPMNAASEWRIQAAANGDRIAQIQDIVMRFDKLLPDDVSHMVESVIRQGDADELLALSEAMWRPIPLENSYDSALSGSQLASQSWAIAACRRGANCGPSSRTMRYFCLLNGICESYSYEDFIFSQLVAPADRAKIERLVSEIGRVIDG